jgi:hypothetical protein
MKIKQVKNKTFLPDELIQENYIVNKNGIISQNEIIINDKNKKTYPQTLPNIKPKSSYILFVQETTNKLKNKNPSMTPKSRKEEVSRLWKLEKSK